MNRSCRLVPAIAVAAILASACDNSTGTDDFDQAVEDGASCAELFEIRNELDPHSPLITQANERLRSIGCYMSSSERTDGAGG